jgi:hypothetical protein
VDVGVGVEVGVSVGGTGVGVEVEAAVTDGLAARDDSIEVMVGIGSTKTK